MKFHVKAIIIFSLVLISSCSSRPFKITSDSLHSFNEEIEEVKVAEELPMIERFPSSLMEKKGCNVIMNEFFKLKNQVMNRKLNRDYLVDNDYLTFNNYDWANQLKFINKKYRSGTRKREHAILILGILKKRHPEWDDARILRKFNALSSFCHS